MTEVAVARHGLPRYRPSMRLGLAVLLLVILTSCGTSKTFEVHGILTLAGSGAEATGSTNDAGEPCAGKGGYDDIAGGAQVTIRSAEGKKIAIGALDAGTFIDSGDLYSNGPCVLEFHIRDIPATSTIYSIEVAHRGEVSFKEADAEDVKLALGG